MELQVLQNTQRYEGNFVHPAQLVVGQVDLLDITLCQVLEGQLVDSLDLVVAEVDLLEVAQGRKLMSLEPGQDCGIRSMSSELLRYQFD